MKLHNNRFFKLVTLSSLCLYSLSANDIAGNTTAVGSTAYNFLNDVTLDTNTDITLGVVTSGANNIGTVSIGSNVTTSTIGNVGSVVKALDITTGTTNLNSTSYITTTTISNNSAILNVNSNLNGNLVITNGTVNLSSSTITGTVTNNGTLTISGTSSITGNVVNSGSGNIDVQSSFTASGSVDANNLYVKKGVTLNLDAAASTVSGNTYLYGSTAKIDSDENTDLSDVTIVMDSTDYYGFGIGVTNTLAEVTGGNTLTVSSLTNNNDTSLVYFTNSTASNKIDITMNYQSAASLNLTGNDKKTYEAAGTAIYSERVIFDTLNALNASQIKTAIQTFNPRLEGVSSGTINLVSKSSGTVSEHLSYVRDNVGSMGISSGSYSVDKSVWGKIYYSKIDQDSTSDMSGYQANGYGVVVGIDKKLLKDKFIYGVAASIGQTNVKSSNSLSSAETDVDSYQGIIYATYHFKDFFVEGIGTYSFNNNSANRQIIAGGITRVATSDYDTQSYSLNLGIGYPFDIKEIHIVPKLSLVQTYLRSDSFSESGAGALNLNVDSNSLNMSEARFIVDFSKVFQNNGSLFVPNLKVGYTNSFGDEYLRTNSTFQGGGSSFETISLLNNGDFLDYGVGLTYITSDRLSEFNINYDGVYGSNYSENIGTISAKFKF